MAQETIFRIVQKGRFFDFTVYTDPRTGRPIFRQRYNATGKGIRYLNQQMTRVRWRQVINSYRELMPFVGESFTDKERKQSSYNAFISANMRNITTYLTRDQARQGGCILQPLIIAQGPLEPIDYDLNEEGTKVVSNIRLDGLTEITSETTIGQLSRAITPKEVAMVDGKPVNPNDVRESNMSMLEGDEIYFYRLHQEYVDVPTIYAVRSAVMLVNNDDRTLWSQTGEDGFTVEHTTVNGVEGYYLACSVVDETAVAWVHTRKGNPNLRDPKDVTLSSTQKTLGESSLAPVYRTHEALLKAIDSYGGVNRVDYSAPSANNGAYELSLGTDSPEEGGTGNTGPTNPENPENPENPGSGSGNGGNGDSGGEGDME